MRCLINSIKDICSKHMLEEKIIIAPSHSAGLQLINNLAKEGHSFINLKTETTYSLAEKICKAYIFKNNFSIMQDTLINYIFMGILKKLKQEEKLNYFKKLEITPGISKAVKNAVLEMKIAEITSADIKKENFVNDGKGEDIKNIFEEYKVILRENKYLDSVDVYKLALQLIPENQNTIYIILSNSKFKHLEKKFINKLTCKNYGIAYFTPLKNMNRPSLYYINSVPELKTEILTNRDRMTWLYDLENAPKLLDDNTTELVQAYGETNEVREVIRKIKIENISLEQVAVFYTVQEPYSQLFLELSQKLDIPVTFGEGINIKNTRPGRVFFALSEWIKNKYDVSILIALIRSGEFTADDEDAPTNSKIIKNLRSAKIGWGRERYIKQIEKQILSYKEKIKQNEDEEKLKYFNQKLEELKWLNKFFKAIFEEIPEEQENSNYGKFVKGFIAAIDKHSSIKNEIDAEAKNAVIKELEILSNADEILSQEDILNRLESIIEEIRVNSSNPKPGHLHITRYTNGIWISRSYNFVVGLDAQKFPGKFREDPILLDVERKRIKDEIPLKSETVKTNIYEMVQLLAGVKGKLILSYSAFDTVENKEIFPSSLLMQAYRLQKGDINADYSDLIKSFKNKKGFIPYDKTEILDEAEYWLKSSFIDGGIKNIDDSLKKCCKHYDNSLKAWDARSTIDFTSYDGFIEEGCEKLDPRDNNEIVVSSTQLEYLAKCPFAYFLKHILEITPPQETSCDPGVWLDPASRGKLLHSIYENFYKELNILNEKPQFEKHEKMLYEIADELTADMKEEIPFPSEMVYEYEHKEIQDSCQIFLKSEEEACQNISPCYFELSFGLDFENDNLGKISPVLLKLPAGECIYLNGKIDKVDKVDEDTYIISDYKTGSTYNYNKNKYYKYGSQLQHTLYAAALEKILSKLKLNSKPQVVEGGYVFPTLKGEGQRIMRKQDNRRYLYEIITNLCDILKNGSFVITDENNCTFCDYKEVCRKHIFKEALKEKINNSNNTILDAYRRLKEYE